MMSGARDGGSCHLEGDIKIGKDGLPHGTGVSLFDAGHIQVILNNYAQLKEECAGHFTSDAYCLLQELENLVEETLPQKYPMYYDILKYKINGVENAGI
jgi:hypothetical protein